MHEGQEAALHDLPNWIAQFPNVLFASHDDATKTQRQQFSQMGVKIVEFPETQEAAGAAIDLGEAVIRRTKCDAGIIPQRQRFSA